MTSKHNTGDMKKRMKKHCDCPCAGAYCTNLVHPCQKPKEHYSQAEEFTNEIKQDLYKKLEPVLNDFLGAGKLFIKKGYEGTGTEMIENIGYIKSLFLLDEEGNLMPEKVC